MTEEQKATLRELIAELLAVQRGAHYQADSILSLILKEVEGARLTEIEMLNLFSNFIPSSLENERWYRIADAQLEAVKKLLGGK
jgi:hypothetical protein